MSKQVEEAVALLSTDENFNFDPDSVLPLPPDQLNTTIDPYLYAIPGSITPPAAQTADAELLLGLSAAYSQPASTLTQSPRRLWTGAGRHPRFVNPLSLSMALIDPNLDADELPGPAPTNESLALQVADLTRQLVAKESALGSANGQAHYLMLDQTTSQKAITILEAQHEDDLTTIQERDELYHELEVKLDEANMDIAMLHSEVATVRAQLEAVTSSALARAQGGPAMPPGDLKVIESLREQIAQVIHARDLHLDRADQNQEELKKVFDKLREREQQLEAANRRCSELEAALQTEANVGIQRWQDIAAQLDVANMKADAANASIVAAEAAAAAAAATPVATVSPTTAFPRPNALRGVHSSRRSSIRLSSRAERQSLTLFQRRNRHSHAHSHGSIAREALENHQRFRRKSSTVSIDPNDLELLADSKWKIDSGETYRQAVTDSEAIVRASNASAEAAIIFQAREYSSGLLNAPHIGGAEINIRLGLLFPELVSSSWSVSASDAEKWHQLNVTLLQDGKYAWGPTLADAAMFWSSDGTSFDGFMAADLGAMLPHLPINLPLDLGNGGTGTTNDAETVPDNGTDNTDINAQIDDLLPHFSNVAITPEIDAQINAIFPITTAVVTSTENVSVQPECLLESDVVVLTESALDLVPRTPITPVITVTKVTASTQTDDLPPPPPPVRPQLAQSRVFSQMVSKPRQTRVSASTPISPEPTIIPTPPPEPVINPEPLELSGFRGHPIECPPEPTRVSVSVVVNTAVPTPGPSTPPNPNRFRDRFPHHWGAGIGMLESPDTKPPATEFVVLPTTLGANTKAKNKRLRRPTDRIASRYRPSIGRVRATKNAAKLLRNLVETTPDSIPSLDPAAEAPLVQAAGLDISRVQVMEEEPVETAISVPISPPRQVVNLRIGRVGQSQVTPTSTTVVSLPTMGAPRIVQTRHTQTDTAVAPVEVSKQSQTETPVLAVEEIQNTETERGIASVTRVRRGMPTDLPISHIPPVDDDLNTEPESESGLPVVPVAPVKVSQGVQTDPLTSPILPVKVTRSIQTDMSTSFVVPLTPVTSVKVTKGTQTTTPVIPTMEGTETTAGTGETITIVKMDGLSTTATATTSLLARILKIWNAYISWTFAMHIRNTYLTRAFAIDVWNTYVTPRAFAIHVWDTYMSRAFILHVWTIFRAFVLRVWNTYSSRAFVLHVWNTYITWAFAYKTWLAFTSRLVLGSTVVALLCIITFVVDRKCETGYEFFGIPLSPWSLYQLVDRHPSWVNKQSVEILKDTRDRVMAGHAGLSFCLGTVVQLVADRMNWMNAGYDGGGQEGQGDFWGGSPGWNRAVYANANSGYPSSRA